MTQYYAKKLCYQFRFSSISEKLFYHTQCRLKCHVESIVNTTHQHYYSGYVLAYAFCSGVVKDRETPFSLNYVPLKSYLNLGSFVITHCFLSASVVEVIFSHNLTRLKYYANWTHGPNSQVSYIWMQLLSKTFKPQTKSNVFLVHVIKNQFYSSLEFFVYICGSIYSELASVPDMFLWKAWMCVSHGL